MSGETPQGRVVKALYMLHQLMILPNSQNPIILNLFFFFCHHNPLVTSNCPSVRYWYGTSLSTCEKILGTLSLGSAGMPVFLQILEFNGYLPGVWALLYTLLWITTSNTFLTAPQLTPWNSNNVWVLLFHALN